MPRVIFEQMIPQFARYWKHAKGGELILPCRAFYSHFLCLVMDSFVPLIEYLGGVNRDRQNLKGIKEYIFVMDSLLFQTKALL